MRDVTKRLLTDTFVYRDVLSEFCKLFSSNGNSDILVMFSGVDGAAAAADAGSRPSSSAGACTAAAEESSQSSGLGDRESTAAWST